MSTAERLKIMGLRASPTILAVSLCALVQILGLGEGLDRRLHDQLVRLAPARAPRPADHLPDVAVVTIDPRSLRASEPWPWSRSVHALAVERLEAAGARAIAFDIDFSSPGLEQADRRFADALAASGHVVLATFSQRQQLEQGGALEIVNRPVPMLAQSAAALGSVLVPIDADGVVRRAPRASEIGGESIRSLARAALGVAAPPGLRDRIEAGFSASTTTRLDFRRALPAIPTVAYIDLIEDRFDRARLAGKTVFIGATAAEFQDLWATPTSPAMPGVMIQAIAYRTAAAEAMGEPVLADAPLGGLLIGFLALGWITMPRASWSGAARGALFVGTAGGLLLASWIGLWRFGIAFPVTTAICLVGAQYALGVEGLRRRIRALADAQESSLVALSRLGDVGSRDERDSRGVSGDRDALELALELLGDVVGARGVVLLRALPEGRLTSERLEWRPGGADDTRLNVDDALAVRALAERRAFEAEDESLPGAANIYSPLVAGREDVGVLVVLCPPGQEVDSIRRRTIATVGAQLALTAQNMRLIERLRETFESSIAAVAGAVEARDGYTDQHCRRLAAFSSLMGARLGLPENEIRAMELGALLHDVGKIGIPDAILNKPGRLTDAEREDMQRHPEIGAGIIAPVIGLEATTLACVIHHHERWDGRGYPEGLEAEEIPLAARIVSIVDVWDALSTARPYKQAMAQPQVRDLMLKGRGTQFDPRLVDLFFEILDEQGDEMLALIARSSRQEASP